MSKKPELKVTIMDNGWMSTYPIDPNDSNAVEETVNEYIRQKRKELKVGLMVTYQVDKQSWSHYNYQLNQKDEAVEFLNEELAKDESK